MTVVLHYLQGALRGGSPPRGHHGEGKDTCQVAKIKGPQPLSESDSFRGVALAGGKRGDLIALLLFQNDEFCLWNSLPYPVSPGITRVRVRRLYSHYPTHNGQEPPHVRIVARNSRLEQWRVHDGLAQPTG